MIMYRIKTKVQNLEHKRRAARSWIDKTDPDNPVVCYDYEDMGWFVTFANSHESLFVGMEEPLDLTVGTEVTILIAPSRKDS